MSLIIGFFRDEDRHWVAELDCGHTQHVRHDPPWRNRPWVLDPFQRRDRVGQTLVCLKCERGEPVNARWMPRL
ncbi:MAG: DUF3565 domain-containing protein [Gammaproteobacteria bacterium]